MPPKASLKDTVPNNEVGEKNNGPRSSSGLRSKSASSASASSRPKLLGNPNSLAKEQLHIPEVKIKLSKSSITSSSGTIPASSRRKLHSNPNSLAKEQLRIPDVKIKLSKSSITSSSGVSGGSRTSKYSQSASSRHFNSRKANVKGAGVLPKNHKLSKQEKKYKKTVLKNKVLSGSLSIGYSHRDSVPAPPIQNLFSSILKTTQMYLKLSTDGPKRETQGKIYYEVLDETRKSIFTVVESSFFTGGSRPFFLSVQDLEDKVVFTVQRHGSSLLCCFGTNCFGSNVSIEGRSIEEESLLPLGTIRQKFACGKLEYQALDQTGRIVMNIYGPRQRYWWRNSLSSDITFQIFATAEHLLIGELRIFSAPKPFDSAPYILMVEFPQMLKPEFKIILIGVTALVVSGRNVHINF